MLVPLVLAAAFHDLAALEADAAAVAGAPVAIDRRLRLGQCADPPLIARSGGGLTIACTAPAWRIYVATQRLAPATPLVRRGDPVSIAAGGAGFEVAIDGIAETDAAAGARIRVATGRGHLTAVVRPDGSLVAPGYNSP